MTAIMIEQENATAIPVPVVAAPAVVGSAQQEAFWAQAIEGKSHIVLMARAGCGKTFSTIEAARRVKERFPTAKIGFSAFNSHIANELKEKVPSGSTAFTLHSLGKRALEAHAGRSLHPTGDKLKVILQDITTPDDMDKDGRLDWCLTRAVEKVVSLCKSSLLTGTREEVTALCEAFDVELDPTGDGTKRTRSRFTRESLARRVGTLVPQALEAAKAMPGVIDFDDMIWLPVALGLKVEAYHMLIIDECQDMNRAQQALAFQACPKGRIIVVGDDRQAIYGFRGADSTSMQTMTERLRVSERGVKVLPLTQTRRCGKRIVAEAQTIVPDIEAFPDAPEGAVEYITPKAFAAQAKPGDMVLCRTNAPMASAAHQFLRAGKKAIVRGKDVSSQIKDLMRNFDVVTIEAMGQSLSRYRVKESERLASMQKPSSVIMAHEDRCETLEVLMEGCGTVAELEAKIDKIFNTKDEREAIVMCSVHGSKGLEAGTVYILKPELMPHPRAKKPADVLQEQNLRYVAITRAKHRLVYVVAEGSEVPMPVASAWKDEANALLLKALGSVPASESELRVQLVSAMNTLQG